MYLLFAWAAMCFYLLCLHVCAQWMDRPVFHTTKAVDPWYCNMSNMHKYAFGKTCNAKVPCYTYSATTATNSIMRLSFEQWMEQDVISWKSISVRTLACGGEWWFAMRTGKTWLCSWMSSQFFLPVQQHQKSFLPLSPFASHQFCLKAHFHIVDCLGFIKNGWGRPLKLFTERVERDWYSPILQEQWLLKSAAKMRITTT